MNSQYTYFANFHLISPLNEDCVEDARKFLRSETELAEYFTEYYPSMAGIVESIEFDLFNEEEGQITVLTTRKLNKIERDIVSDYIRGQCSDGVGESFEQQEFAYSNWCDYLEQYVDDRDCIRCDCEDEECALVEVNSSFDWETNEYKLNLLNS